MTEEIIDVGNTVICDICCKDYTNSPLSGGFLFASHAYCPDCASLHESNIHSNGEGHLIKARCPRGMPFAEWILQQRGSNNRVIIRTL